MRILLSLIIPTLLILAPIAFQLVYTVKRIRNRTNISIFIIFLLALVPGLILPFAATFISMYGLTYGLNPGELKCVNGIQIFMFFGIGITIIATPLIGVTGALFQYFKLKRQNLSTLR